MPQPYERFWLHDTAGAGPSVHIWRASMGSDPYTHTFYVRLIQVLLDGPDGRLPFEQACLQAAACKPVTHPQLLRVYAWGEAEGRGWLAVEHPDGYDLEHLVETLRRQRLRIPAPLAVHVTLQTLRALDWLHKNGLAHGAVHPGAVFVGAENRIKLAAPAGASPIAFHTPAPCAAEPASGPGALALAMAADVRAAAAMLQALLAARGAPSAALPADAAPAPRRSAVRLMPTVPAEVAAVLRRALSPGRTAMDAATLYRALAACELADPMTACAPLLRFWVQTAAEAAEVAQKISAAPAWAQAPMRALFGAPKRPARRKSLIRRMIRA